MSVHVDGCLPVDSGLWEGGSGSPGRGAAGHSHGLLRRVFPATQDCRGGHFGESSMSFLGGGFRERLRPSVTRSVSYPAPLP